jgi:hypothetical protein
MTTEWSHLPNAIHIDRILASLKTHPEQWSMARDAARSVARSATRSVARDATWSAAWSAAWDAARSAARDTEWNAARNAAWNVSRDAILCLIAYDDCAYMIESEVGELKILAAFGDGKAVLLLPACIAFHSIKELETV